MRKIANESQLAPARPPDRFISLNSMVEGAYQVRRRHGETPIIAPRVILQAPIWNDCRSAAKRSVLERHYSDFCNGAGVQMIATTSNPLQVKGGHGCAGGLLRHFDLDVIMALSLAWMRSGSRDIEIEQREIFRLYGHTTLDQAPYRELKASLHRLRSTSIGIYQKGTPLEHVTAWSLLEWTGRQECPSAGGPVAIQATLSRDWEAALTIFNDWQLIDFNAYANLVRLNRRNGLSRQLYLFFASWRKLDGTFDVPLRTIIDRFEDRRPNGHLRCANPFRSSSRLLRAFIDLTNSGVITLDEIDSKSQPFSLRRIRGSFHRSELNLFVPERESSTIEVQNWNRKNPRIQRKMLSKLPNSSNEITQERDAAILDLIEKLRTGLSSTIPKNIIEKSRTSGWSLEQIYLAFVYVHWRHHREESVRNPGGYLCSLLEKGNDDESYRMNYSPDGLAKMLNCDYEIIKKWVWENPLNGCEKPPSKHAS
jgi:hypothetical protein